MASLKYRIKNKKKIVALCNIPLGFENRMKQIVKNNTKKSIN